MNMYAEFFGGFFIGFVVFPFVFMLVWLVVDEFKKWIAKQVKTAMGE